MGMPEFGQRREARLIGAMLAVLLALGLSACAETGFDRDANLKRIAAGEVRLDPDAARAMINHYRAKKGLKPVKLEPKLAVAAKRHSDDLAKHDRISHRGSDGSDPWDRVKGTGYKAKLAAENVGAGQMSLDEVFRGWQDSPEHNANLLLPDATHMGISLVIAPETNYQTFWTLVLGTPR